MNDQAKMLRQMALAADKTRQKPKSIPRIITVASGKGGVGKTNLSVNLGIALSKANWRVAVIDADIGLANVDIALGIRPKYTLRQVLLEERSLDEAVVVGPGGLHVVAGGSGVHELDSLDPTLLQRFVNILESMDEAFDIVLIDTGAGVGPHVLSFASASPETLMVVTPDPSSIADAYAVIKAVSAQQRQNRWLLAVNMTRNAKEGEETFRRLDAAAQRFLGLSLEFLGSVPRDDAVEWAIQIQTPFVLSQPRSAASRSVIEMAKRMTEGPHLPSQGIVGFMQRLLRLGG